MFERLLIVENFPGDNIESVLESLREQSIVVELVNCRVVPGNLQIYDGVVLYVPPVELLPWIDRFQERKKMPLFWFCPVDRDLCSFDFPTGLDGLLYKGMPPSMMEGMLRLGLAHFEERNKWILEYERLKSKLEERKVIDRAKEILAELKNISLTEAYQFLRKQAMQERRNIVEISRSIVTAYQLIRSEKESKRR